MSNLPTIAVVTTAYFKHSHADVIVSRWLEPRATDAAFGWPVGGGDKPRTRIASLYTVQCGGGDIGREIASRHGVAIASSVREALTLGSDKLAVDGVLLIGEHGDYPTNELRQKMYPRRELLDEIVEVFRASGRSVPIFNDKHLSYDADSARHMVNVSRELGFPLMAGSSITAAGFLNGAKPMQDGADLASGVAVFYDSVEAYVYHSIEFLQSVAARRASGEAGISAVTAYCGDGFWQAEKSGAWSTDAMQAAMACARNAKPGDYRANLQAPLDHHQAPVEWPVAFCFEHSDGFKSAHLMLHGHVADFSLALQSRDGSIAAGCSSSSANGADNFYAHFAQLSAQIEEFMLTGRSPLPLDHTLLCTLATEAAMRALANPGVPLRTPGLEIAYRL